MLTTSQLASQLWLFRITGRDWGHGKAKTLGDLCQEIEDGETYLRVDWEGLFRVVQIIHMVVHHPNDDSQILMEKGQYLPDNRYRDRNILPTEKVKRAESPWDAFYRGMKEEFRLPAEHYYQWGDVKFEIERSESPSYPGLMTEYQRYDFMVNLRPEAQGISLEAQFEIATDDDTDTRHVFSWMPKSQFFSD